MLQIAFGIWCHWNTFYKYQLLDFSDCPQSIHHDIFHICELYPENVSLLDVRCLADFHNIIARCCIGNEKMPFPQKLIITLSVTIRYFPAIFEEIKHIHNAMKLRTIPFSEKIECFVVPFMMAASTTVEELSAAAVTRGIENPAPKTSITQLKFHLVDYLILFIEAGFTVAAFML